MRISVLGPEGTFSDSAAKKYIESAGIDAEIVYCPTIDEAFEEVGNGCDIAIVPIENTLDGYVQRTLDLLLELPVHIQTEVTIPVRFSLVANADKKEDINRLFVQFKSAGQCRGFVSSLNLEGVVTTESNMISYYEAEKGNERCKLALDMFCYQVSKYIGAYAAAMGGVDAIVFTAGIGENNGVIREKIIKNVEFLGTKLDAEKNAQRGFAQVVSEEGSRVQVCVIPTNEELAIAQQTLKVISK